MASVGPPRLDHQSQVSPVSSRSLPVTSIAPNLWILNEHAEDLGDAGILSGNGKNGQQELKANSKLRLYWPSWPNHVVFSISASNQKGAHTCTLTDQQQNAGETLPRAFHVNLQLQGTHFVHANNPARFSFSPKRWRSNVCINCSRTSKKARVTFDSLTADSSHTCRISALKKYEQAFSTTTWVLTFSIHKFDNDTTVSRASICIKLYAKSRLSTNLGSVALLGCQKDWPLRCLYFDIAGWRDKALAIH